MCTTRLRQSSQMHNPSFVLISTYVNQVSIPWVVSEHLTITDVRMELGFHLESASSTRREATFVDNSRPWTPGSRFPLLPGRSDARQRASEIETVELVWGITEREKKFSLIPELNALVGLAHQQFHSQNGITRPLVDSLLHGVSRSNGAGFGHRMWRS